MNVEYYRVTLYPEHGHNDRPIMHCLVAVEAGLMGSLHFPSHVEVETVPADEDIGPQHEDLVYGWDQFLESGNDVDALWKLLPHLPETSLPLQLLEAKYARPDRQGEHPRFPIAAWHAAAAAGTTESWYWLWVRGRLTDAAWANEEHPLTRVMPHEPGAEPVPPLIFTTTLPGYRPLGDDHSRRLTLTVDPDLHVSIPFVEEFLGSKIVRKLERRAKDDIPTGLNVHLRSGYRVTVESEVRGKEETTSVNAGSLWWCYRTLESAIELHLLNCDRGLEPQELEAAYDSSKTVAEHPLFKRSAWVEAIQTQQVLEGYWEWAYSRIDSRLRRLEQVASVDSPSP